MTFIHYMFYVELSYRRLMMNVKKCEKR